MRYTLFFIVAISCWFNSAAQQASYVKLQGLEVDYAPKLFYIKSFVDDRDDTTNIGSIENAGKPTIYKMKQQLVPELNTLNAKQLKRDTGRIAVDIHIKELELSKKQLSQTVQNLHIYAQIYLDGKYIFYYKGDRRIPDTLNAAEHIEMLLKLLLEDTYKEFDYWLKDNRQKLEKKIIVKTEIDKSSLDTNLLVFNKNIALQLSDFKKTPDYSSPLDGSPYIEMRYVYNYDNDVNIKTSKINISIYLNRKNSWIRPRMADKMLPYYQGFFYIYALKACEVKMQADTTKFSYDDAMKEFDLLFQKIDHSVIARFDEYSNDTERGRFAKKVEEWSIRLKKEIEECDCYD